MTKERPSEPGGWALTSRFPNADQARAVYKGVRDLLLTDDLDASVFRFSFAGASFVAVIGREPLHDAATGKLQAHLSSGEPAEVPAALLEHLRTRRSAFKELRIEYLERRLQQIVICPECQRSDITYCEDVPTVRNLLRREGETVVVDGLIRDHDYESASNQRFFCVDCGHEWPTGDTSIEFE